MSKFRNSQLLAGSVLAAIKTQAFIFLGENFLYFEIFLFGFLTC